jgi:hypothetical protein
MRADMPCRRDHFDHVPELVHGDDMFLQWAGAMACFDRQWPILKLTVA